MTVNASDVRALVLASIDARKAYELNKNSEATNMCATLDKLRKSFDHDAIAATMLACSVNADFINHAERSNARFNVYSAEKVQNILAFVARSSFALNHYTLNILKTCAAMTNADVLMTHSDAVAACSSDSKIADKTKAKLLVRYARITNANTASTQASSSLNALKVCNVISETRDAANNVSYRMRDTDAAKALLAALAA